MSVLFTINLQNVSARFMIYLKFTKIKVNYETGAALRKQTTYSNNRAHYEKLHLFPQYKFLSLVRTRRLINVLT